MTPHWWPELYALCGSYVETPPRPMPAKKAGNVPISKFNHDSDWSFLTQSYNCFFTMWNHSAARLAQYLALATIINSPGQRPNGVSDLGFDPCLIVVFDNCCLPWEPRGWRWYPPCQVDECRTPLGRPKADFYWFLLPPGAHQKINEFRSLPETAWEVQKSTQGCPRTDFSSILRTSWCHSEKAKTFKNGVRIIKYQGFWPPKTVNFSKISWGFF